MRDFPIYLDTERGEDAEVNLGLFIATVTVPPVDHEACVAQVVAALHRERTRIIAEHTMALKQLDDKIGNLLAITHQPVDNDTIVE